MKSALQLFFLFCAFIGLAASPASAHHGWGGYNIDMDMMATVTETHWENPHDRLIVTDGNGERWNLLLAPPIRNRRYGFGEDTVSIGDEIRLIGQSHATKREAKVHLIYRGTEQVYEYLYGPNRSSLDRMGKAAPNISAQAATNATNNKGAPLTRPDHGNTPILVWIGGTALLLLGLILAFTKAGKRKKE